MPRGSCTLSRIYRSRDSPRLNTLKQQTLFRFTPSPSPSKEDQASSAENDLLRRASTETLMGSKAAVPLDATSMNEAADMPQGSPSFAKDALKPDAISPIEAKATSESGNLEHPVGKCGRGLPRRCSARAAALTAEARRAADAHKYGNQAKGVRVSMFWRDDDPPMWYDGTVRDYGADEMHLIM